MKSGEVLLFDFGAQVEGYRSDMTRTLFVGEPTGARPRVYEVVAAAQDIVFDSLWEAVSSAQRGVAAADGPRVRRRWPATSSRPTGASRCTGTAWATGSGSRPTSCRASAGAARRRRSRIATVFSVEPGIYMEGETGVRIEDLVIIDVEAGQVERITNFPRDEVVVGV